MRCPSNYICHVSASQTREKYFTISRYWIFLLYYCAIVSTYNKCLLQKKKLNCLSKEAIQKGIDKLNNIYTLSPNHIDDRKLNMVLSYKVVGSFSYLKGTSYEYVLCFIVTYINFEFSNFIWTCNSENAQSHLVEVVVHGTRKYNNTLYF